MTLKWTFKSVPAHRKTLKLRTYKNIGKLIDVVCKLDDNNQFIAKDADDNIYKFTPMSFDNKGKSHIFIKTDDDKKATTICVIRDAERRKNPAPDIYTPVAYNWIYRGHLMEFGDEVLFNIEETLNKNIEWYADT